MKTSNRKVVAELKRLVRKDKGFLLPQTVLEAARPVNSVLHKHFCWDDTEAAELYRLIQAKELIRVTVHWIEIGGERRSVRVFVSLSPDRDKGRGYREIVTVLENKSLREQMLRDALEDLALFERRYQHLKELTAVFTASKTTRKQIMEAW